MFHIHEKFRTILIAVIVFILPAVTPECVAFDRKYSCNCVYEQRNETISVIESDKYNSSAFHFVPALASVQHCSGRFNCRASFKPSEPPDVVHIHSYMLCFSDISCLLDGGLKASALQADDRSACFVKPCLFINDLLEFNISNDLQEVSTYSCLKIDPEDIKTHLCLKTSCNSFMALEKPCVCNFEARNCQCSNYCENTLLSASHDTYALFFSFGDIFTTMRSKGADFNWAILVVLCTGLVILLVIFCRLCKAAVDPSCEVQNAEMVRRIMLANAEAASASVSTTAKSSFSAVDRCSPPPTYEQVLKDKCIEFKKSVA